MKQRVLAAFLRIAVLTAPVFLVLLPRIAEAISEAEKSFLSLYFSEDELQVVSATRSLQSIARVAENMEVVTADDIELMNAHTLADVLNTVSGAQVQFTGSFGVQAMADIQGANFTRVTVLMNGVPLNNFNSTVTDVGFYPVQDIEKIEIVKGPASAAWGSALGGVVNIITKGPGSQPLQARASLSYGTKNSADYRTTISGRSGRLGYYLSGSGLQTDGLTEGFAVDAGYFGTRLDYAVAERTSATFTLFYGDASRGDGILKEYDLAWSNQFKRLISSLSVASAVGEGGRLALSLWGTSFDDVVFHAPDQRQRGDCKGHRRRASLRREPELRLEPGGPYPGPRRGLLLRHHGDERHPPRRNARTDPVGRLRKRHPESGTVGYRSRNTL